MMTMRSSLEEMVDRRQERIADRLLFAGRVEQLQNAGSTVMLAVKATIMPTPAISPSSETPL